MKDTADHATSPSEQDSIGRWKTDLPDWEVAMIQDGLGSELGDPGVWLKR